MFVEERDYVRITRFSRGIIRHLQADGSVTYLKVR